MPLLEQERHCIDLACRFLQTQYGGYWSTADGPTLDEQHPAESSPEALVHNGRTTAAIEVKRLKGDLAWTNYFVSQRSLRTSLVPPCGGSYVLNPCVDFRLPVHKRFAKLLKREIARVAPLLEIGQAGEVRIPRKAALKMSRPTGPGHLHCCHSYSDHVVRALSPRLVGAYWIDDESQWEHSFITEPAQEVFFRAVMLASEKSRVTGTAELEWEEEWEFKRIEGDEDSVRLVAVTGAIDRIGGLNEALGSIVDKGRQKFTARRWADLSVLIIENGYMSTPLPLVRQAVLSLSARCIAPLDLILWVDEREIHQIWPLETAIEPSR